MMGLDYNKQILMSLIHTQRRSGPDPRGGKYKFKIKTHLVRIISQLVEHNNTVTMYGSK